MLFLFFYNLSYKKDYILNKPAFSYKWISSGDIGASATIIFDNLTILTFISIILEFVYSFPREIILTHIIPGTVFGILIGNIFCIWISFKLAHKQQKNVTAIPLGLDAPSTIGFIVCIVGPVFNLYKTKGYSAYDAGIIACQVGSGSIFILGIIKLLCSFLVKQIKNFIPQPALLGAIGGVALAFIGFFPLISIFKLPIVGFISLVIVLLTMFTSIKLPFNISGIPASILIGTLVYYILVYNKIGVSAPDLTTNFGFLLPLPSISFFNQINEIINQIPLIIPFALLVVFGTMSVAESAKCVGEDYNVKSLVILDSIATISSSLFGGIAQTTPYAGFPAYKKLDSRAGFLVLNIIVVGIGGIFGAVGFIVNLIPESAIAPVLLFVAFEIMMQSFIQCDKKYITPILFSFFPSVARLLQIKLTDGTLIAVEKYQTEIITKVTPTISDHLIIVLMGNGFIITGVLWGAMLTFAIDKEFSKSLICCTTLAVLSYFGIIHSVFVTGQIYLPQNLPETIRSIPLQLSIGYIIMGIVIYTLGKLSLIKK
jgi:AGZA family xanthine/uracil permease-like MFS transporter